MPLYNPPVYGSGEGSNVFSFSGDPNGNVTATGPAVCIDDTTEPDSIWTKTTAGTSNNEWH